MFLGTYEAKFSGKNRIILPKKFRQQLKPGGEIVLSKGLDGCIWGFAKSEWLKEAKKQLQLPATEERGRFIRRYTFAATEEISLDDQGRFIIPSELSSYAGLQNQVVLVGAGDRFEIWSPQRWNKQLKDYEFTKNN